MQKKVVRVVKQGRFYVQHFMLRVYSYYGVHYGAHPRLTPPAI